MATFAEQAAVAKAPAFVERVQMAMLTHAQYRINAGNDAQGYVTLGRKIIHNATGYASQFAQLVTTTSFVQDGIEQSPDTGAAVDDASIGSAVEVVYPSFV